MFTQWYISKYPNNSLKHGTNFIANFTFFRGRIWFKKCCTCNLKAHWFSKRTGTCAVISTQLNWCPTSPQFHQTPDPVAPAFGGQGPLQVRCLCCGPNKLQYPPWGYSLSYVSAGFSTFQLKIILLWIRTNPFPPRITKCTNLLRFFLEFCCYGRWGSAWQLEMLEDITEHCMK